MQSSSSLFVLNQAARAIKNNNGQRTDRNTQNMQYIYNKNGKNTFTSKAKSYANGQQCDLYKNYTRA